MNLEFLTPYFTPVVAGIVMCICFMIHKTTDKLNRYIPLIAGLLGLIAAIIQDQPNITLATVLTGLFSGLSATGLYEALDNLINKK